MNKCWQCVFNRQCDGCDAFIPENHNKSKVHRLSFSHLFSKEEMENIKKNKLAVEIPADQNKGADDTEEDYEHDFWLVNRRGFLEHVKRILSTFAYEVNSEINMEYSDDEIKNSRIKSMVYNKVYKEIEDGNK